MDDIYLDTCCTPGLTQGEITQRELMFVYLHVPFDGPFVFLMYLPLRYIIISMSVHSSHICSLP